NRSVVMWVFISVIMIEGIILIPSYENRRKELLSQLREVSTAKVELLLHDAVRGGSDAELIMLFRKLTGNSNILGGRLYRAERNEIGSFGEKPSLDAKAVVENGRNDYLIRSSYIYEFAYRCSDSTQDYILMLRHDASTVKHELNAFILRIAGLVLVISFFVTTGAWLALVPLVIDPILKLRQDLNDAGEAVEQDRTPSFRSVTRQRRDELGDVIAAFSQMFDQIQHSIEKRKTAENLLQSSLLNVESYSKALNNELEKGKQIQRDFLPNRFPELQGWETSACFYPAKQVSGDFYDAFRIPEGLVGFLIGDVSDKGIGAALYMALIRSLIRIFSGHSRLVRGMPITELCLDEDISNPGSDVAQMNALKAVEVINTYIVQEHEDDGMFASLFFGVLDPANDMLAYINAGHEPLFLINKNGKMEKLKPTGPVVGLLQDTEYTPETISFEPGDALVGYTDGVTEARSPMDELYSRRRLQKSLGNDPVASADKILENIQADLFRFTEDATQSDDITIIVVRKSDSGSKIETGS
ncbi:MAG: PP2C family protein-serine/threonine phosphatase, partial [Desulfobacterales bacterium]